MIEGIIVAGAIAAAVYLLRPLFTISLVVLLTAAASGAAASAAPPEAGRADQPSIGLLLVAIEAKRDHLRISEALRISNAGEPAALDLQVGLPEGAVYLTFHRGIDRAVRTGEGFAARLTVPRGLSEIAYSYAIPAGVRAALTRTFPLRVQRLEVVARGPGVALAVDRGRAADPVALGGVTLPRWEVLGLEARSPVTVMLDHLPVSRPWLPRSGAAGLAVLLASGLTVRLIRPRPDSGGDLLAVKNS